MAEFTISITGDVDADEARATFEDAVRRLRAVLAEFDGELTVDGVTESADDVSDDAAGEEEGDQTDEAEAEEEEATVETTKETI